MTPEDQHTVEVLVASATNEAIKKVQELIKEQGMGMLGGMPS